jgi:non-homologous end joining protein Ku
MARDKRMKTNNNIVDTMHQVSKDTSQRNEPGQERNQVCKTMNQHKERRQEKTARDERMKMNNDVIDVMHQVSKNMSQRSEPGRERNQVCNK